MSNQISFEVNNGGTLIFEQEPWRVIITHSRLTPAQRGIMKGDRDNMEITLDCGVFRIGEYSIAGNYDDGYTVWETDKGDDSDTLYSNVSLENCITWCLNS